MSALKAAMQNAGGLSSLISFGNLEGMLSSIIEQQNSIVRRRPPRANCEHPQSDGVPGAPRGRYCRDRTARRQHPTRDAVEDTQADAHAAMRTTHTPSPIAGGGDAAG